MFPRFCLLAADFLCLAVCALGQNSGDSQVQQARQFSANFQPQERAEISDSLTPSISNLDATYDSFGAQHILKSAEEKPHPYDVFADVSAFFSNNVGLTHHNTHGDAFLVANFGLNATRPITDTLEVDFTTKAGIFRYDKRTEFDLDTFDAGIGVSQRLPGLWDATLFASYDFTDLLNGLNTRQIFNNHAFTIGTQKSFSIREGQSLLLGVSAQFNISYPHSTQRDEYGAYWGYHADLTSRFSADLFYRYAFQPYVGDERHDHNQTLTLSLRFVVNQWLSLIASTYLALNRSDESYFSYNALAGGIGLSANARF